MCARTEAAHSRWLDSKVLVVFGQVQQGAYDVVAGLFIIAFDGADAYADIFFLVGVAVVGITTACGDLYPELADGLGFMPVTVDV